MKLIADSGSTKTSWCLIKDNTVMSRFFSEGYNPCYMSRDYITRSLKKSLPDNQKWKSVDEIVFYGAGCYENKYTVIQDAMQPLFPQANVFVAMDLLGSARALLGNNPGFAAILGTGTNSCLYDGRKITCNIDSLGFMLGDEGSGGYIGKRLIGDYIRGYMPENIYQAFTNTYRLTPDELIDRIYLGKMPNRYCASFTRFITAYGHPSEYLNSVVYESFSDFFKNIVCGYSSYKNYTFNCVGNIGWIFRNILISVAQKYNMKTGKIISEPMQGLIEYYSHKNTV
jgi:N-acetylglucosamine kinase-like BadF-type ATPase